jgi:GWxTD domain-containing protein
MKKLTAIVVMLLCASLPSGVAGESFAQADSLLAGLPPQERATFSELELLMNSDQIREYLMLPNARERSRWIGRFWIGLDPTPTTNANERRAEHERRILLARARFASPQAPGWDNRGEVLIRYGAPAQATKSEEDVTPSSYMLPGEIWYYDVPRMVVRFQRNIAGEYVCSGDPVIWHDKQSRAVVPMEPDYCADELFNPGLGHMIDPDGRYLPEDEPLQENEIYRNIETRPFIHSCDIEEKLHCYIDVTTFGNADRSLRTEISFEVPSNEIQFFGEEDARMAAVEFRVLVRDSTMRKIAFERDRIKVSAGTRPDRMLLPGQVALRLKPGHYWMGLEAYDSYTKKRASFMREIEIAPRNGSPDISDIQFASGIRDAAPGSRFAKGSLQVVPHPARAYRIPFPISFYFEIYGLDTDQDGKGFYRVEYSIVPLEKKRWGPVLRDMPAIVSSFETSGYGSTQPQRLSIATEELWKGPFRLEVTITDRRTLRTAVRSATFSIVE